MKTSVSVQKKRYERSQVRADKKLTARFRSGRKAEAEPDLHGWAKLLRGGWLITE